MHSISYSVSRPAASEYSKFWSLDRAVTFLNHGSFGACPLAVLERQRSLWQQLEQQPLRFMVKELEPLLDQSRAALANFVGAEADDLVFVPNATTGINTVLRSLSFQPQDELLTTNQEYNASRNALDFVAERLGATVAVADIPFPIASPDQVVEAVLAKVSAQTKLVLLDHVVSQTSLVLPIQTLAQQLSDRGIELLVDGAHAPGMIPLNLAELGATYYTGNCHKWLCAPKGSAFLYVQRDRQHAIRPLTISHGANSPRTDRSRFHLEFDWTGTDDPTAYLCVEEALRFLGSMLPGGWTELMRRNRDLAIAAQKTLCQALGIDSPCPVEMIGSMATVPLPDGDWEPLYNALGDRFNLEVPIIPWYPSGKRLIRISAQIYNHLAEYNYLADALLILLKEL
jgi:isopenicillin-N epimerase